MGHKIARVSTKKLALRLLHCKASALLAGVVKDVDWNVGLRPQFRVAIQKRRAGLAPGSGNESNYEK